MRSEDECIKEGCSVLRPSVVTETQRWLDAAKEARDWEREARRGTVRCWGITSRASPSPPSGVWRVVAVWSVSPAWSTRRPEACWRCSSRTSSGMPSPTPNTPRGRPSPPWTLSTPSRGRDAPCTDSEVKHFAAPQHSRNNNRPFSGPPLISMKRTNPYPFACAKAFPHLGQYFLVIWGDWGAVYMYAGLEEWTFDNPQYTVDIQWYIHTYVYIYTYSCMYIFSWHDVYIDVCAMYIAYIIQCMHRNTL